MINRWSIFALSVAATLAWTVQPSISEAAAQEAPYRASAGDTVWILLNHVKPDQRGTFERFVEQVLRPALQQAAAQDSVYRNILTRGRVLYPTRQNSDSTYTYVYVMEHYIPGNYSYRRLFSAVYTPAQTEEYLRMPAEALARPQETYFLVQTRYW